MNADYLRQTRREVQAGMLTRYAYGHGPEKGLIGTGRLRIAGADAVLQIGNVVDDLEGAVHLCVETAGSGHYYIQEQP